MVSKTPKTFLIDFDGTLAFNDFPYIGGDVPHAVDVLRKMQKAGHTLVLLTMRHDHLLDEAEMWCHQREIEIKYSNCNPEYETGSRKVYGNYHIDDHNVGIPLSYDPELHHKKFVDWKGVEAILIKEGLI